MGLFSKLFKPSNKTAEIQVNSPVNKAIEEVKGYSLTYHYEDVEVCVWDGIIPPNTTSNNKIVFIQEKNNKADNRAVLLLLVPQKKKLERVKEAYEAGVDTLEEYKVNKAKITAKIAELEALETEQQPKASEEAIRSEFPKKLRACLKSLKDEQLSETTKNETLKSIIERITFIKPDGIVEILYRF